MDVYQVGIASDRGHSVQVEITTVEVMEIN